jgi:plasmid stability protein
MPKKTITFSIRNFPVELNRRLKVEAAARDMSLEAFAVLALKVAMQIVPALPEPK